MRMIWGKSNPWRKSDPWKKIIPEKTSVPRRKSNPRKKNRVLTVISLLCLTVTAVLCSNPSAQAAGRVDMEKRGRLTLLLAADSAQMGQDMAGIRDAEGTANGELTVHAWKLADMLESGQYDLTENFAHLLEEESWREMSVSEDGWKNLSKAAMASIYGLDEEEKPAGEPERKADYKIKPDYNGKIHVTASGTIEEAAFSDMDLGLYLIVVDEAQSPKYKYTFTPVIVSLPWSEYQYLGEKASDDTWQYEREAALKPARELRYGSIKIVKELTEYNVSQGDVTFVFDVTARESAEEDAEIVYSNVVSLTFQTVGVREVVLDHIPAGAAVTVTEVYSGANCGLTESERGSKAVIADGEEGSPVTFSFQNKYDEDRKSGCGVENRFRYNTEKNTYQWTTDRPGIGDGTAEEDKEGDGE